MTIDRAPTIREMAEEFQQTLGIGSNYLVMFGQAVAARERERLKPYLQHRGACAAETCRVCRRGSQLDDGYCSQDKYGLHRFESMDCTCGLQAIRSSAGREA